MFPRNMHHIFEIYFIPIQSIYFYEQCNNIYIINNEINQWVIILPTQTMHTIKRQIQKKKCKLFHDPYSISLFRWTFPSQKTPAPWQSPTRLGSKTWCTKGWKIWRPKMTGKNIVKLKDRSTGLNFFWSLFCWKKDNWYCIPTLHKKSQQAEARSARNTCLNQKFFTGVSKQNETPSVDTPVLRFSPGDIICRPSFQPEKVFCWRNFCNTVTWSIKDEESPNSWCYSFWKVIRSCISSKGARLE